MFRLLKRAIAGLTPSVNQGRIVYDTSDARLKFLEENGLAWPLSADGMRDQNILINGGFDYAQRQAPATLTTVSQTASRGYTADRWGVTNENASAQYRRVDTAGTPQTGLLARFYGEFSKITSTGKIQASQAIESGNCQHLRGRKVRLQMKLKASSAKTMRIALLQLANAGTLDTVPGYTNGAPAGNFISAHGANSTDPTFGTNLAKIAPDTVYNATSANSGATCSVTTVWQLFGATFTLPTDFKNLVVVVFTDSQFAVADNFSMSEVGLYDGTEVRDWAERMQVSQLLNCQRYFSKSFSVDVAPAQNVGLVGAQRGYVSVAAAVAGQPIGVDFPAGMRGGTATFVFYNPSAGNAFVRNTTAGSDATATASANAGDSGFDITFTGIAAWTVAQACAIHWTCDNEI